MIAKLCPCGCCRLSPCPAGQKLLAEKAAKEKDGARKRWDAHHAKRPEEAALYRTPRWREIRAEQLKREPWCICGKKATDVDHREPHRGDERLFFEPTNLRSMCRACHMAKTRRDR